MSQMPAPTPAHLDVAEATNEPSFFRDLHTFRALTEYVIPELVSARGAAAGLTIWCPACAGGQEPYSVALAVTEAFPELVRNSRLRVLATDLSPSLVDRTRAGRFTQREVNLGLPVRHLLRHFQQDGTDWVASRQLRQVIDARPLDLLGFWPAVPRCDVVFLRDALTSLNRDTQRTILDRIRRDVLRPGGHLFLGPNETITSDEGWTRRIVGRALSYASLPAPAVSGSAARSAASLPITQGLRS